MLMPCGSATATDERSHEIEFAVVFVAVLFAVVVVVVAVVISAAAAVWLRTAAAGRRRMWAVNSNETLERRCDGGNGVATVARILRAPNCAVAMYVCMYSVSVCVHLCMYVSVSAFV